MSRLDDIACWGIGIISSGTVMVLTDLAIQSSQKYSSLSRVAFDVGAGAITLLSATFIAYAIRDKLFYEEVVSQKDIGTQRSGPMYRTVVSYKDKRTGQTVSSSVYETLKDDNR